MNESLLNSLSRLVADHTVFAQQMRNHHWNLRGPLFLSLHDKFEELYEAAAEQVDSLAERLLALGATPPSTLQSILELSTLEEITPGNSAEAMLAASIERLSKLTETLHQTAALAEGATDRTTTNLLDGIADAHQHQVWMLRASMSQA